MDKISIDDFKKVDIRVGTIVSAERVPDTDKLIRLCIDLGEKEQRQIVSGIAEYVEPEDLIGKQCPFVTNLEPRVIKGLESNGMIFAAGRDDTFALLHPNKEVPPGTTTS